MTPQEQSIVEQAREILSGYVNTNDVITSWTQLCDYAYTHLANKRTEVFHVLFLDRKNRLIEDVQMAHGTVDHVPVYPREVIKKALELDASAMILIHNHPSGDPTPSASDITMTQQIESAAKTMDITVHDHLIIGSKTEYSMRASGDF